MATGTQAIASLSEAQRRQFEAQGYLCPVRVMGEEEAGGFLSSYQAYAAENEERLRTLAANQKFQVFSETHFALPWVHQIVTHPRILDAAQALLGPNLLAWNTNWFSKMPGERSFVGWHQDGTYWNLQPPTVVTAWVALSPSRVENGCMRVVPGTHTQPALPQRETYNPENALSRGQEIAVTVNEADAVNLELNPGEMSLHHIWIVHGSAMNTSKTQPRIGLAIRYTKPEVRQDSPQKPLAMLVRGEDRCGNFELLPAPVAQSAAAMRAHHASIVARIRASIMTTANAKPG